MFSMATLTSVFSPSLFEWMSWSESEFFSSEIGYSKESWWVRIGRGTGTFWSLVAILSASMAEEILRGRDLRSGREDGRMDGGTR